MVSVEGRCRSQWKQWLAALAAILPIVMVGFLGALVNVTVAILHGFEDEPEHLKVLAVLLTINGCVIGAISGAVFADIFGRKKTLFATTICVVGGIIGLFPTNLTSCCIIVSIGGINAGIVCTAVPLYISEIADDKIRGRLLMLQLPGIYIGQLIVMTTVSVAGPIVMNIGSIAIPIIFLIAIYWFPESPYYLASKKQYEAAAKSLAFFRGIDQEASTEEVQIVISSVKEYGSRKRICRQILELFRRKNQKGLIIVALLIIVQWNTTFIDKRADLAAALNNIVSMKDINALIVMSATRLIWSVILVLTIDTVGRRLYLLGSTLLGLAIASFATVVIMDRSYILFLAHFILHLCQIVIFGVPLVFVGELFPANVRSTASSLAVIFGTTCKNVFLFINWSTPGGAEYDFWVFIPIYLLAFLFILAFVPETKKNTSTDIENALADTRLICRRNTTSQQNC